MNKKLIFALILATACNNKPVENKGTSADVILNDSINAKPPEIKKQYYPDGALFREINVTNLDAKLYTGDGKLYLKGHFNDTNYVLNGVWEEWNIAGNYKTFELTYENNVENGAFRSFRKDGKLYASGMKKDGVFTDTLKFFDKEGKVFEMQVYKPDAKEKGGTKLVKTINLNDMRSDGTIEKIEGKMYKWEEGERVPVDEGK